MDLDNFIKEYKVKFKERTGVDLDTCTQEEYEQWYHQDCKSIAEIDIYMASILKSAEDIIENKRYSMLVKMLQNYDGLVKEKISFKDEINLPYWDICFCGPQVEVN